MRAPLGLLAIVLFLLALPVTAAEALTADGEVVVCDIDTGINPAHQEFAADQIVGFFDFSDESVPAEGELFDADTEPFDPDGHGTATAAMIGALGVSEEQTPAGFPGVKLAMAKVADADGAIAGDLAAAMMWCVDTVRADAINMSIGVIVPLGPAQALFEPEFEAMRYARSKGVLFTVANGNGIGNTGVVPGDGATTPYGSSLDVLSVGASGVDGLTVAYNPEVAALYTVRTPTPEGRDTYRDISGTSFASPFTGGFGARMIAEAVDLGLAPTVLDVEQTIKNVAADTAIPPIQEGYGVIDLTRLPDALAAIGSGTVPEPADSLSALYVENGAGAIRMTSNGYAPGETYDDPGAGASVGSQGAAPGAEPTPTPTATATATAAPEGTATPTATPDGTGTGTGTAPTPAAAAESGALPLAAPAKPTLSGLRVKGRRLRLLVDQRVTLTVVVRRAGARVSRRVLAFRGPGAVKLRLGSLKAGRYAVRVRAKSELGAGSVTARKRFRVR